MGKHQEARLICETGIEIANGVVYTTFIRNGKPCTVALLLHDYCRHHQRASEALDAEFAKENGKVLAFKH